jgi:hypothetical protein
MPPNNELHVDQDILMILLFSTNAYDIAEKVT